MEASHGRGLLSFLAEVPDPRDRHGRRHSLAPILALSCCAIMCGARSYTAIGKWGEEQDIAFMHKLGFMRKPPKMGGIRKVLMALDARAFEDALTRWAGTFRVEPTTLEGSADDGELVQGSLEGLGNSVRVLSLMARESGLTAAQEAVPDGDKDNGRNSVFRILEALVLKGRMIDVSTKFSERDPLNPPRLAREG